MRDVPKLYVEVPRERCMDGRTSTAECIVLTENVEIKLKHGEKPPECIDLENARFLMKEVYDRFHTYVDKASGRMLREAIIVLPDGRTRIHLREGDQLILLPVEGFSKTIIADVGNRVRKGDAFAAVTTKKGEVHYLKPPRAGTVVFIDEISDRPHYTYYILPEG